MLVLTVDRDLGSFSPEVRPHAAPGQGPPLPRHIPYGKLTAGHVSPLIARELVLSQECRVTSAPWRAGFKSLS